MEILWYAALLAATVGAAPDRCGSPAESRAQVESLRSKLVVGTSYAKVVDLFGKPAFGDSGGPPRAEEGPWLLIGRSRAHVTYDGVFCDFDKSDRLLRCKSRYGLQERQKISEADFNAVAEGLTPEEVAQRLCEPGARTSGDGGAVVFEYSVQRPHAKVNQECPGYLKFRKGRMAEAKMICR